MRPAVRYCITAGVALGGVSILIAAPSSPPLRDVEVPAMQQLSNNSHGEPGREQPVVCRPLADHGRGGKLRSWCRTSPSPMPGWLEGGQPANVPHLSDLLNLGNDPVGAPDPQGKSFIDIGPLLPGDITLTPPAGR